MGEGAGLPICGWIPRRQSAAVDRLLPDPTLLDPLTATVLIAVSHSSSPHQAKSGNHLCGSSVARPRISGHLFGHIARKSAAGKASGPRVALFRQHDMRVGIKTVTERQDGLEAVRICCFPLSKGSGGVLDNIYGFGAAAWLRHHRRCHCAVVALHSTLAYRLVTIHRTMNAAVSI
jgi:hypothetical protein